MPALSRGRGVNPDDALSASSRRLRGRPRRRPLTCRHGADGGGRRRRRECPDRRRRAGEHRCASICQVPGTASRVTRTRCARGYLRCLHPHDERNAQLRGTGRGRVRAGRSWCVCPGGGPCRSGCGPAGHPGAIRPPRSSSHSYAGSPAYFQNLHLYRQGHLTIALGHVKAMPPRKIGQRSSRSLLKGERGAREG